MSELNLTDIEVTYNKYNILYLSHIFIKLKLLNDE